MLLAAGAIVAIHDPVMAFERVAGAGEHVRLALVERHALPKSPVPLGEEEEQQDDGGEDQGMVRA